MKDMSCLDCKYFNPLYTKCGGEYTKLAAGQCINLKANKAERKESCPYWESAPKKSEKQKAVKTLLVEIKDALERVEGLLKE